MPAPWSNVFQYVDRNGVFCVGRIEVDDVSNPVRWDVVQQLLHGITVRVDKADPLSGIDVIQDHVLEKRGLSHSGIAAAKRNA